MSAGHAAGVGRAPLGVRLWGQRATVTVVASGSIVLLIGSVGLMSPPLSPHGSGIILAASGLGWVAGRITERPESTK